MLNEARAAYARPDTTSPARLIETHSALVRRVAWHVHSRMSTAIEVEDLIQIGFIALVEAAQHFEDRGIAFAPYASTRIRGAMVDALRRDARMGRAGMANRRYLASIRAKLEQEYMRPPSDAEMASAAGLEPQAYYAMAASTQAVAQDSIDESYSDHDMWFADLADSADTALEKAQLREALMANLAKLTEREAAILQLYFVEELNLDEIGETLGVGAARVCQIKKAALDKMRSLMMD
ncbi:FliA/WhiG family RNA polymerase sigma factor [Sphingorhabdus sp. IMCC26285]|jgi:RNA polymerase sigma factor for flagellar operon FliA|uniref:FliA/WhiG family RNA polymerase sigma factor n=1 Tax=Sphingorhabdus profundilacus TaxID=2509718 RepID=A0A6I4M3P9_9SPHN|nr:FliA/WhiG family RNA polymerase sigma factor [Sphingorhabdus profundilacus]MVZ98786.1 FliA/WhiG family RNA polymerase sigma factor [Sphingorhabdus profundilacus]